MLSLASRLGRLVFDAGRDRSFGFICEILPTLAPVLLAAGNILGGLGWLEHTDTITGLVRFGSMVAFLGALGLAAWFAREDLGPTRSQDDSLAEWDHLPRRTQ